MKYQGEINLVAGASINFLFLIQDKTWLRTLMIIHFLAPQLELCQRENGLCPHACLRIFRLVLGGRMHRIFHNRNLVTCP